MTDEEEIEAYDEWLRNLRQTPVSRELAPNFFLELLREVTKDDANGSESGPTPGD